MTITCPDCQAEDHFCPVHQKYEKEVYESTRFRGKHNTREFRCELCDARRRDLEEL